MADIGALLDLADLACVRAEGVVSAARLRQINQVCDRLRMRQGFLGEVLVAALAGGTGGGKSSIVNALVGQEVVDTSVIRPTTAAATAVIPAETVADLEPMLDALQVEHRQRIDGWRDVVLVDLPDFDSTVEAHRAIVEEVVPTVDAVIWVLDPEKYADPVLHREFLGDFVDHESQFVFVLNQIDRLGDDGPAVLENLTERLRADGFEDPAVVSSTAVDRGPGGIDVSRIAAVIERRFDAKTTAMTKSAIDLARLANESWTEIRHDPDAAADADAAALSAATFVWLGVEAHQLRWDLSRELRTSDG